MLEKNKKSYDCIRYISVKDISWHMKYVWCVHIFTIITHGRLASAKKDIHVSQSSFLKLEYWSHHHYYKCRFYSRKDFFGKVAIFSIVHVLCTFVLETQKTGKIETEWSPKKNLLLPPAYVVRREGNSFTLFVCPHLGGVPISHNALQHFPECHEAAGGVPGLPPGGWYLTGYPPWGGVPRPPPRGVPGPPLGGTWPGTPPGGVPGPPRGGYPGRTTEGVLTTRRAVCLLRSRRRTFLFFAKTMKSLQMHCWNKIPLTKSFEMQHDSKKISNRWLNVGSMKLDTRLKINSTNYVINYLLRG